MDVEMIPVRRTTSRPETTRTDQQVDPAGPVPDWWEKSQPGHWQPGPARRRRRGGNTLAIIGVCAGVVAMVIVPWFLVIAMGAWIPTASPTAVACLISVMVLITAVASITVGRLSWRSLLASVTIGVVGTSVVLLLAVIVAAAGGWVVGP